MLLERYYDESLAQASFLVGCERTREAIVIDPNRDVDRYVQAAAAQRMRIRYVTETHIHADFLSGSRDLAASARATLVLSNHGGSDWTYAYAQDAGARLVRDGDSLDVGSVQLRILHTPGHTPEHISFLVTDTVAGKQPMGMFTGDFVFVGDVGRPDLLERAANVTGSMEGAARQLHGSLQRLKHLPDYLQIWPGHGAGSACGKALGSVPQSTLGYERLVNPAFHHEEVDAFVRWVLADQPEAPRYFAMMKRLNRDGPPPRPNPASIAQLDAASVVTALDQDHWVLDVRGSADFARLHVPGVINIPASRSLPTYAGTVLTYEKPIVLIATSEEQARAVLRQLSLIGMDRIAGWATLEVLQQVQSAGRRMESRHAMEPAVLAERLATNAVRVIDVRGASEWKAGHLEKATHIFLGDLMDRTEEMDQGETIIVHCQTGTRASIAASLLRARGFSDVMVLSRGFDGWRKAGLPIVKE